MAETLSFAKRLLVGLRRRFGRVIVVGLGIAVVGFVAWLSPVWWLLAFRSGRLALITFVVGIGIEMVGLSAGFRRIPNLLIGAGLVLGMGALLIGLALARFGPELSPPVYETTTVPGPGSHVLFLRRELSNNYSDVCFSLELRVGRGLLRRSRDVIYCASSQGRPVVGFHDDRVVLTMAQAENCEYRIDTRNMRLVPLETQRCPLLP